MSVCKDFKISVIQMQCVVILHSLTCGNLNSVLSIQAGSEAVGLLDAAVKNPEDVVVLHGCNIACASMSVYSSNLKFSHVNLFFCSCIEL